MCKFLLEQIKMKQFPDKSLVSSHQEPTASEKQTETVETDTVCTPGQIYQCDNDLQIMQAKTCGDSRVSQLNVQPVEICKNS